MATKKPATKTPTKPAAKPAPKQATPKKPAAKPAPRTKGKGHTKPSPPVVNTEEVPEWAVGLPLQWRTFCEQYVTHWNASKAYEEANFEATGDSIYANSSRLLRHAKIQAALKQLLSQHLLSDEELHERIMDDALASIDPFVSVDDMGRLIFDWKGIKASGLMRHFKKLKIKKTKYGEEVDFELVDRQKAMTMLMQLRGLNRQTLEVTGKDGGAVEHTITMLDKRKVEAAAPDEVDVLFEGLTGKVGDDDGDD